MRGQRLSFLSFADAVVHLLVEVAGVMLAVVRNLLFRTSATNHGLRNSQRRMLPGALHDPVDPIVGRGTLRRHGQWLIRQRVWDQNLAPPRSWGRIFLFSVEEDILSFSIDIWPARNSCLNSVRTVPYN